MSASPRFAIGASTHPGMVRADNEDAYVAVDGLFLVADGMGGHQAGEVASAIAVDTLHASHTTGLTSVIDLERAVRDANSSIRQQAAETIDRAGMGTTLSGLAALKPSGPNRVPQLAVVNVGDSRTYLLREQRLVRLTVDHSYVQELVRAGQITDQEARFHPRRNIVTRALGIDHSIAVDAWVRSCVKGDRYLVCSDGLVDEVPDHEIAALLAAVSDPQAAADQLVEMANRHGGRDNVTVVVVDVLDGLDEPEADDAMPASAVDDSGLPTEVSWADADAPTATLPITGTSASADATRRIPVTAAGATPSTAAPSTATPSSPPTQRRFGLPQLAFLVALGAILTVVIVVVVLAVQSEPDAPLDTPATAPATAPATTATTPITPPDSVVSPPSSATGATTTPTPTTIPSGARTGVSSP